MHRYTATLYLLFLTLSYFLQLLININSKIQNPGTGYTPCKNYDHYNSLLHLSIVRQDSDLILLALQRLNKIWCQLRFQFPSKKTCVTELQVPQNTLYFNIIKHLLHNGFVRYKQTSDLTKFWLILKMYINPAGFPFIYIHVHYFSHNVIQISPKM